MAVVTTFEFIMKSDETDSRIPHRIIPIKTALRTRGTNEIKWRNLGNEKE